MNKAWKGCGAAIAVIVLMSVGVFGMYHVVHGQQTDTTTGMVAPSYTGTGAPTKTCSSTNLAGVAYFQTDATNGRQWICMVSTDGVTWSWQHFTTPILGTSTALGGSLIALGGNITGTVAMTGATVGSNCTAARADGAFLPVGMILECAVSSANTVTIRISAAIAGTPTAATYNVRVIP